MKYSIMVRLNSSNNETITGAINKYKALDEENWYKIMSENGKQQLSFELKTPELVKKNRMFQEFKQLVSQYTGEISWHECTHDEENPQPCIIAEEYKVGD